MHIMIIRGMKILMKPIEVLAHFEENGTPHPIRLKFEVGTCEWFLWKI